MSDPCEPTRTIGPGSLLAGRWRLEVCVGEGGMGEVWRGHHEVLRRAAAIKVVRNTAPASRERLLQEARVLASIRHPAVVEVFDFGEHEDVPFYVMEPLIGRSLGERIRSGGPISPRAAVELIAPVLDGLEAAHAAGVVHRDVKPDNVFLVATALGERPKLVDFGIARVRDRATRLTMAGAIVGTPDYMAPEQIQGLEPDARADVWAIGVTIYEAIAGRPPFEANDIPATLHRVLHEAPERVPMIDDALWAILLRALDKSPALRFPSASAFAAALGAWSNGRLLSSPTQTMPAAARADQSPDPLRGSLDALLRGKLTPR